MDWSIKCNGMKITNSDSPVNMLAREAAKSEAIKTQLEVYKQARELAQADYDAGSVNSANYVKRVADYVKQLSGGKLQC